MKNRNNKRNEFYVYKVVRKTDQEVKEQEQTQEVEQPSNTSYVISPHFGRQEIKTKYESMGYHRDPSSYDFIRGDKKLRQDIYQRQLETVRKNSKDFNVNESSLEKHSTEVVEVQEEINENVLEAKNEYAEYEYFEEEQANTIDDLPVDVFAHDYHSEIRKYSGQPAKEEKTITETPKPSAVVKAKTHDAPKQAPVNIGPKISKYVGPKLEFLSHTKESGNENVAEAERQKAVINRTFQESGIRASVSEYIFGPTVTQFFIKVEPGVNVDKIQSVESNLTMYLEAESIRLQIPIPGKPFAGIEVPKKRENRKIVHLGDLLDCNEFKNSDMALPIAVGQDNYGTTMYIDIAEMPHCLIAGTTKSGKSVSLNAFVLSLIYKFSPRELRLVLIDPKRIELGKYEGIPHLAMPVVVEQENLLPAVTWVFEEMERRYNVFQDYDVVNIVELNKVLVEQRKPKLPYVVMMMDEFSDWITSAGIEAENMLQRIAQKARAAGIHVILAAQRPSKNVIKGDIKANFDTRLAFRVSSFDDAKIILGSGGAEKLEGYGDMLIRYAGRAERRLQGAFVSNTDVKKVVNFLRTNNTLDYIVTEEELKQSASQRNIGNSSTAKTLGVDDELFDEIAYYVVRNKNASVNSLSRQFNTGFNRMNDIFLGLEDLGIVSKSVKGKSREVLVDELELEEILENK